MMTEIKHALAFIFGVLYASCWWVDANDSAWKYLSSYSFDIFHDLSLG